MAVPLMFQPLVKYAQFEGRSRRSEFWLWLLFRFLLGQLMSAVAFAFIGPAFMSFGMHPETYAGHPDQFFQAYMNAMTPWFRIIPLISLVGLALFIPSLAVGVRRLHDINRSGWWLVMPYAVAIIGFILFLAIGGTALFGTISAHPNGDIPDAERAKMALSFVGSMFLCFFLPMLIAGVVMLVFFVTEGTKGPNRFGPDPKAVSQPGGI